MTSFAKKEDFQRVYKEKEVSLYTLKNDKLTVNVTNYGCRIVDILVPKGDKLVNVITGYRTFDGFISTDNYMGAIVGRYANRIDRGKLVVENKEYQLPINNGINTLHGGLEGYDRRVFTVVSHNETEIKFELIDNDGMNNYPGTVTVTITYKLYQNDFQMYFEATTDKTTVVNISNHAYLNLNGNSTIYNHSVQINANHYLPVTKDLIPTGVLQPVENTPFDFRNPKCVGKEINEQDEQLLIAKGYDHNFCLNPIEERKKYEGVEDGKKQSHEVATIIGDESNVKMIIYSTQPGVQFYTFNFDLEGFELRSAYCLETQNYPDSPNQHHFPSPFITKDEKYEEHLIYHFE